MYKTPAILFFVFWTIAIVLWQTKGNLFYLFNFGYLGTALGIGLGLYAWLPRGKKPSARRLSLFLIGTYMLVFLGLIKQENMQIEGFFFYALSGLFSGATIHYTVAKILGPVLFGRGYCGWGCWTAALMDLLPYKKPRGRVSSKWEYLRYVHFVIVAALVLALWFVYDYHPEDFGTIALTWLIVGNLFYYALAIILAFALKDNRAFCKYVCPITVFMKPASTLSLLKIDGSSGECIRCASCSTACPMDIDVMEYVANSERVLSTECILCQTCTTVCPVNILETSFAFDVGGKDRIQRAEDQASRKAYRVEYKKQSSPPKPSMIK
jgi:polyferredoxin